MQISTWKTILLQSMQSCCGKEYQTATEINFFVSFVLQFAVSMLKSKVQIAPPTENVIIAVLTPKLVIQLTTLIAFDTGRKLNSACCNYVHFSYQPLISVAQKRTFPNLPSNNSHTMHRFIIFMSMNQDDDDIDYKYYVKNLLRFFNKNVARERIDKRFKQFCYFGLLNIVII